MDFFDLRATKNHSSSTECLLLPESRNMAKLYCSALCNLSGMCEYFMTTEETRCPRGCSVTEGKSECILFLIIINQFNVVSFNF